MSSFSLPVELTDDLISALVDRARELGLIRDGKRWVHIEGLARYLGCEVSRVRQLRGCGLPAHRLAGEKPGTLSKKLLFDLDEVDAWIEREGVRV